MDLYGGLPYWLLVGGMRTVVPPLDQDAECDVAVIGSGITGALIAHRLSAAGQRVIVDDRRDLGQGSTMASTSLLLYELDVPLYKLERILGTRRARRAYAIGVQAVKTIRSLAARLRVPVETVPSIYIARREARLEELRAEFAARRRVGLAVRWLGTAELGERWGVRALGGIESRPAAQVDPFRLTHALLASAVRQGARVYDRTGASSIGVDRGGVRISTDRGATVRSAHVIHAGGYEVAARLPRGLVSLRSTYAIASEPIGVISARRCVVWERAEPYIYIRWAGDRLLVGGEDRAFVDASARDRRIQTAARALARKASDILPGVAIEPAFAWSGTFATTPDGLGYIGTLPGRPREHFALGFGGNGMTFAAVAGGMIARRVLAGKHQGQDRSLFAFDRERC